MNIPNTGQLDRKTIAEMHKPRCGVPDFDDDDKPSPGKTYCNLRDWSFFIPCGGKVGGGGGGGAKDITGITCQFQWESRVISRDKNITDPFGGIR